jgi:membrane protein YqaA with SNARE-associated domain
MPFLEELGLLGLFIGSFLAATIVPFSSDVLFFGMLYTQHSPLILLCTATAGNTLGGITSYFLGYFAKWQWLEIYFGIKQEAIFKKSHIIQKYGFWLALLSWLPFIGDILAVALGFFRIPKVPVFIGVFLGKGLRYALLIYLHKSF